MEVGRIDVWSEVGVALSQAPAGNEGACECDPRAKAQENGLHGFEDADAESPLADRQVRSWWAGEGVVSSGFATPKTSKG